jgi:hypothetical protein
MVTNYRGSAAELNPESRRGTAGGVAIPLLRSAVELPEGGSVFCGETSMRYSGLSIKGMDEILGIMI